MAKRFIYRSGICFSLAFLAGYLFYDVLRILNVEQYCPIVYSNMIIKNDIEGLLRVTVPADATELYCASSSSGWLDYDCYIALSLPTQEQCKEFVSTLPNISFEHLEEVKLPESFLRYSPCNWPDSFRGNWDIKTYYDLPLFYQDYRERGVKICYIPKECRIFIIIYNTTIY